MRYFIATSVIFLFHGFLVAQCPNDNIFYETKAAPTTLNDFVTTELYGGEYTRITGLVAGNTYTFSTCGNNEFDTQITIFKALSSNAEAFNDDYTDCGTQSGIIFTPFTNGNYDIVLDEYSCANNFNDFTEVTVQLVATPRPLLTIPVVVHVLHNNSSQNISDAQILSQIDVLNEDFRRMNNDIHSVPARFRGFSADFSIEFCLASMDPDGNPTDGIVRVSTQVAEFVQTDAMKFSNQGGSDAWDTDKYLNMWVCNLGGGLLGFAQFPGNGAANTDGVVMGYDKFGRVGTLTSPYDGGRTATHEIGHWLDLKHIWGDGDCSYDDDVEDTPLQGEANYSCPVDPSSCSNEGMGGDMSVNYMDYVDDDCMGMFTFLQVDRAYEAINSYRSGLGNSTGCSTGDGPTANFKANVTSGPAPLTVNFSDLSNNNPDTWSWTFTGSNTPVTNVQDPINILYETPGTYTVSLDASNGWGNDIETKFDYITVNEPEIPEGIERISAPQLVLWPNPISDNGIVNFRVKSEPTSVSVRNILGEAVPFELDKDKNQLFLSDLPPGSYVVRISTQKGDFQSTIIRH